MNKRIWKSCAAYSVPVNFALLGGEMSVLASCDAHPSEIAIANAAGDVINFNQKELVHGVLAISAKIIQMRLETFTNFEFRLISNM